MSVQGGRQRLLLSMLNEQLTCRLCGGYFIDATTIIECLHSFCRSCIVKYLEKSKYCPICEVQVHKSKPLLNIRPDYTLQDIVYKLVPGCYQNEMRCRREFYAKHPDAKTATMSPESKGEPVESHIYSPDESLSLSLEYHNPSIKVESEDEESEETTTLLPRRYLRCPAAVTIVHLQKLIRAKYGLSNAHRVDILYKEEPLCSTYTLMDVMYIYHWRRKVPLHLSYRIFESALKRIKLSEDNTDFKKSLSDSGISQVESPNEQPHKEWKEVQLKISETGVMSVTDITNSDSKKNIRTMELDDRGKSELNSIVDIKTSKELIEENLKESNEALKDKSKVKMKDEIEGTITRSAMKLSTSKVEELKEEKLKNDDKMLSTKMDTRASSKEAGKSDKSIKDAKNELQILMNNNSINSEKESETQKQHLKPSSAGSKINALSAKLQFQPKVGQVNNTYSKKGNIKEKKTVTYNLKSSDSKLSKSTNKIDSKIESAIKGQASSKTDSDQIVKVSTTTTTTVSVVTMPEASSITTTSTTSISAVKVSASNTVQSQKTAVTTRTSTTKSLSAVAATTTATHTTNVTTLVSECLPSATQPIVSSVPVSVSKSVTVSQSVFQPTSKIQPSSDKVGIKLSTSITPVVSTENISSAGISYTIKDIVNKKALNTGQKCSSSGVPYSKCPVSTSSSPSLSQYNVQTPAMSIYSTSMKNNSFPNSTSAATTTTTTITTITTPTTTTPSTTIPTNTLTTASTTTTATATTTTVNIATTTVSTNLMSATNNTTTTTTTATASTTTIKVEPKSDSIPPCPDAIPLSMIKSTMRKNQLLTKGTNLSDSSVKISTPGSKIDDICAKIGENSKEKNKLESRSKPEIPGLLEIPKKPTSSAEQVLKQIPSIHVPIFKPSSKESNINCTDSYKILPSMSPHSLQASISTSAQKVSSSKKRVSPFRYKTLRNPPCTWNPTLSKNSYLAIKNQAKELQQQQQAFTSESKQVPSKSSKIFTMRNTPRYLGNPASGVKPMYGVASETSKEKEQSSSTSGSSKGHAVMTKIDPQTLQPIVSMVSTPPYTTNERTFQSGPYSSRDIRSTSSPVSPRNSPVNMLSTSPFIPSPTPNTNPRLIYSTFPPTFPNASRFPHSIMPHSPLGLPPPLSAFHSSLPQVKFYQRSSYAPQTSGYGTVTQPPTVQRIPPSSHSNTPKSPKTTIESKTSSLSSGSETKMEEGQRIPKVTLSRKIDTRVYNLAKPESKSETKQQSKLDFLAKISAVAGIDRTKISPVPKNMVEKKDNKVEAKLKIKEDEGKEEKKKDEKNDKDKDLKEEIRENSRVNGDVIETVDSSAEKKMENKKEDDKAEDDKSSKKETANGVTQNIEDKLEENGNWRKNIEQVQLKKAEVQNNTAES